MANVTIEMELKKSANEIREILLQDGIELSESDIKLLQEVLMQVTINEGAITDMQEDRKLLYVLGGTDKIKIMDPQDYRLVDALRTAAGLCEFEKTKNIRHLMKLAVLGYAFGRGTVMDIVASAGFDIEKAVNNALEGKTKYRGIANTDICERMLYVDKFFSGRLARIVPVLERGKDTKMV